MEGPRETNGGGTGALARGSAACEEEPSGGEASGGVVGGAWGCASRSGRARVAGGLASEWLVGGRGGA